MLLGLQLIFNAYKVHIGLKLQCVQIKMSLHTQYATWLPKVQLSKIFECKIVNIFLPIILSICFGCSKEPSHWDRSFDHPQHMIWLRNKKNNFQLHTLIGRPYGTLSQGCGNTMPDLSTLVPFINLSLDKYKCTKKVNTILYFIF